MDARSTFGHCSIHDLACGPDGRCALCRREASRGASRMGSYAIAGGLVVLCLAIGGAVAYRSVRALARLSQEQLAAQAAEREASPRGTVRLYTTSWCPHCKRAKAWLAAQQVDYVELDVESDPVARREHRRINPRGGVPTLDANGEVVLGFSPEGFQAALKSAAAR